MGDKTGLDCDGNQMKSHKFDPNRVRQVLLWYGKGDGTLFAIELKDESGKSIVQAGDLDPEDTN